LKRSKRPRLIHPRPWPGHLKFSLTSRHFIGGFRLRISVAADRAGARSCTHKRDLGQRRGADVGLYEAFAVKVDLTDIPQMTSKFVEIVYPSYRQRIDFGSKTDLWRSPQVCPLLVTSRRKAAPISISAFGGKADVNHCVAECPLIATSGHWKSLSEEAETFRDRLSGPPMNPFRSA